MIDDPVTGRRPVTPSDLGGGAFAQASFSALISGGTATLPFTTNAVYARYSITGALTIARGSSAIPGTQATVTLVANGTNTPTFSGFTELSGSSGWVNTSGIRNLITFFYDGTTYWYSIQQDLALSPIDVTAPTLSTAIISGAAPTQIVLTYNESLLTTGDGVPDTSDYTISASGGAVTVSSIGVSGSAVTLTCSRSFTQGETVTISYTPGSTGRVQDASANIAASLTSQAVTLNFEGFLRFGTLTTYVESGNGTTGYTYTTGSTGTGLATVSLPPSTDGWVSMDMEAAGNREQILGFKLANSANAYNGADPYITLCYVSGGDQLTRGTDGGGITTFLAFGAAAGKRVRLRRVGSTGDILLETTIDSGSNWTTQYTWTAKSTARLYVNINALGAGNVAKPRSSGLA
ncbi:MAG: SwmB domain-containing protein [Pseudomonadota bacterium]